MESQNTIETKIKRVMATGIQMLLDASKTEKKHIALMLDDIAMLILIKYENSLPCNLVEILEGFLDFHHWGDESTKPSYRIKDLHRIHAQLI